MLKPEIPVKLPGFFIELYMCSSKGSSYGCNYGPKEVNSNQPNLY